MSPGSGPAQLLEAPVPGPGRGCGPQWRGWNNPPLCTGFHPRTCLGLGLLPAPTLGFTGSLWCSCISSLVRALQDPTPLELAGSAEKGLGAGRPVGRTGQCSERCGHQVLGVNSLTARSETGPKARFDAFPGRRRRREQSGWKPANRLICLCLFAPRSEGWGQRLKSCHRSLRPSSLPPSSSPIPWDAAS